MRLWWGMAALGLLVAGAWACDDDDQGPVTPAADAGRDAEPPYVAPPPVPIACAAIGTFDPCDAGRDPSVFGATTMDGGPLEGNDAGAPSDAGLVPSACVASGAVRVACADDAGAAQFSLAAGADGVTRAAAWSEEPASRFDIAADGSVSPMITLPARVKGARIFDSSATGVTVLLARSTSISVVRGGANELYGPDLQGSLSEEPALFGAGMTDDGTLYALFNKSGPALWKLSASERPFDAKFVNRPGRVLGTSPSGTIATLADQGGTSIALYRRPESGDVLLLDGYAFALGFDAKERPLVATRTDDDVSVYAARDPDALDWVKMRVHRTDTCQEGCGGSCTEHVRVPFGGELVRTSAGKAYFVYAELRLTRERKFSTEYTIPCGLFGGCACGTRAEVTSVEAVDAVALEVVTAPYQLVEAARARMGLGDPKAALLDAQKGAHRAFFASARGTQIHVGLQGSKSEVARLVLDLSK